MFFRPPRPFPKGTRLEPLTDVPPMNTGAPCPMVVTDEHSASLLYFIDNPDPEWDGTSVRLLSPDSESEPVAVVRFERAGWHRLGDPDVDVLATHPLYEFGLRPYEPVEVFHPLRKNARRFFFPFHDSSFEIEADGYTSERLDGLSLRAAARAELGTMA